MADRVLQRHDTAANWQTHNPVLAEGELGIITDGAKGYKIGDGVTAWNDLDYPVNPAQIVQTSGNSENAVMSQKSVSDIVGINDYITFNPLNTYYKGDIVKYEGLLYKFTEDHISTEWTGSDVIEYSVALSILEGITNIYELSTINSGRWFFVEPKLVYYAIVITNISSAEWSLYYSDSTQELNSIGTYSGTNIISFSIPNNYDRVRIVSNTSDSLNIAVVSSNVYAKFMEYITNTIKEFNEDVTNDLSYLKSLEYNISTLQPTGSDDNDNLYNSYEAIRKIPSSDRNDGKVVSFLNKSNEIEKWIKSVNGVWDDSTLGNFEYIGGKLLETKIINEVQNYSIPNGSLAYSIYFKPNFKKEDLTGRIVKIKINNSTSGVISGLGIYFIVNSNYSLRQNTVEYNKEYLLPIYEPNVKGIRLSLDEALSTDLNFEVSVYNYDLLNEQEQIISAIERDTESLNKSLANEEYFSITNPLNGGYLQVNTSVYFNLYQNLDGNFCTKLFKVDSDYVYLKIKAVNENYTIDNTQVILFDSSFVPKSIVALSERIDMRSASYYSIQFSVKDKESSLITTIEEYYKANVILFDAYTKPNKFKIFALGNNSLDVSSYINLEKSHVIRIKSSSPNSQSFVIIHLNEINGSQLRRETIQVAGNSYYDTYRLEVPNSKVLRIESTSAYIYSVEIFPSELYMNEEQGKTNFCIPYLGSGRVIISREMDKYCHSPRIENIGKYSYINYHSSDYRTTESEDSEITFVKLNRVTGDKKYYIVASSINPTLVNMEYDGHLYKNVYQNTSWIDKDGNIRIKFCALNSDDNSVHLFYKIYDIEAETFSEMHPLQINYNNKTVDWTYLSWKQMLNELYDYEFDTATNDIRHTEACNVVSYNNKYYMVVAQEVTGNSSEEDSIITPYVLLSSDDGIVWSPIKVVIARAGASETEISILNDKILLIYRNRHLATRYLVCDLSGNILKDEYTLSSIASKPATFVWNNAQYAVYNINIPNTVIVDGKYYGRIAIVISKLEDSNSLTELKKLINLSGFQYYNVGVINNALYFVNTEDITASNYELNVGPYCNITFSELQIPIEF